MNKGDNICKAINFFIVKKSRKNNKQQKKLTNIERKESYFEPFSFKKGLTKS